MARGKLPRVSSTPTAWTFQKVTSGNIRPKRGWWTQPRALTLENNVMIIALKSSRIGTSFLWIKLKVSI
jgi:hypothetical protein